MHVTPCSSLTLICVGCIESPWKNNSTFDHKAWQRWDTSLQPRSCQHTNTIKPTRNFNPLRGWLQSSLVLPTKNLQQGRDIHKPCMIWSLIPELWWKTTSSPPSKGHNLFLKRSRNGSGYCNSWSVSSRPEVYGKWSYISPPPKTRNLLWLRKGHINHGATSRNWCQQHAPLSASGTSWSPDQAAASNLKLAVETCWSDPCDSLTATECFFSVWEWSCDLRTLGTLPRAQGGTRELPRCTVSLLVWLVTYATV